MESNRYPVDVEALESGQTLYRSDLERIVRCSSATKEYDLKVLQVCQFINIGFVRQGIPMLARVSRSEILIESGNEMVDTAAGRMDRAIRSIGRTTRVLRRVDTSELDASHGDRLARSLFVASGLVSAARSLRRKAIKADPVPPVEKRLPE